MTAGETVVVHEVPAAEDAGGYFPAGDEALVGGSAAFVGDDGVGVNVDVAHVVEYTGEVVDHGDGAMEDVDGVARGDGVHGTGGSNDGFPGRRGKGGVDLTGEGIIAADDSNRVKCNYCDYTGRKRWDVTVHVRTHTGERPYECPHCPYKAADKSTMRRHVAAHVAAVPMQCSQCEFTTTTKRELKRHEKEHGAPSALVCPRCDHVCQSKTDLTRHLHTHDGIKPYKCAHCDYHASDRSTLTVHERIHTGDRPFKCQHCDYTSYKKSFVKVRAGAGLCPFTSKRGRRGSTRAAVGGQLVAIASVFVYVYVRWRRRVDRSTSGSTRGRSPSSATTVSSAPASRPVSSATS